MFSKNIRIVPLVLATFTTAGCTAVFEIDNDRLVGSGRIVAESRPVSGVLGVDLSGAGQLTIRQGNFEDLVIEGDDNVLPFVRSDVVRGTLILGIDRRGSTQTSRPLRYSLVVRDLDLMTVSGASDVFVEDLDTRVLDVNLSGASSLDIAGIVDFQTIGMSGASRFEAGNFASLETEVNASGASTAVVNVRDRLVARLSGASNVRFIGRPNVFESVSGGSWVRPY